MLKLTVVDYGIGNTLSVCRAFQRFDADVCLSRDRSVIATSDRLVLPGVGAFQGGMNRLRELGLDTSILQFAQSQRPFLGICLGMQMMLDSSEEFGNHQGLGLIPGKVVAIPSAGSDSKQSYKIPHIGWNELIVGREQSSWNNTILSTLPRRPYAYFVHSFTAIPDFPQHRLADTEYHGVRISAAIMSGNLYGCQFHPEKSSDVGLRIISEFLKI